MMQIYRIRRDGGGFTVIPNSLVRDADISARAKGVWAGLASHQDGYSQTLEAIAKTHSDGTTSVGSALRELESAGYLTRTQERDTAGRLGDVLLTLFDRPQRQVQPQAVCPSTVSPSAVQPSTVKRAPIRRLERQEEQNTKVVDDARARIAPAEESHVPEDNEGPKPPGAPQPFRPPLPMSERLTPGAMLAAYIQHTDKTMRTTHAVWVVAHWTEPEIQNALDATANAGASWAYFRKVIESPLGTKRRLRSPVKPPPADLLVGAHDDGTRHEKTPEKRTHGAEWAKALETLRAQIPEAAIRTWLEPCDIVDGHLDAPSDFHAEMIAAKYQTLINDAVGRRVSIGQPMPEPEEAPNESN